MAYTAPKTWAFGEKLPSSDLNTYVRDNTLWLATDRPRCRAKRTTNQSIPNNTATAVQFNDTPDFDVGDMHTSGSNTRLTCPVGAAGCYRIGGEAAFDSNATNERRVDLLLNGTTVIANSRGAAIANVLPLQVGTLYELAEGDFIELRAFHNISGGGALNVANGNLWAIWETTA